MEATQTPALDKFLAKHKDHCSYWRIFGALHCSCGRNEAVKELQRIKESVIALSKKVADHQDELEDERGW